MKKHEIKTALDIVSEAYRPDTISHAQVELYLARTGWTRKFVDIEGFEVWAKTDGRLAGVVVIPARLGAPNYSAQIDAAITEIARMECGRPRTLVILHILLESMRP
jgi:hypothetical protein